MIELSKSDVLIDVCTQREYMEETSPHRCKANVDFARNIKHLMAFARWTKAPVVSCIDVPRGMDKPCSLIGVNRPELRPLLKPNPPTGEDVARLTWTATRGCVQSRKAPFTLFPRHTLIESDNCLGVSLDVLQRYQQAIFAKSHRDPFTNPKLDRLLTEMPARRFVVFGIGVEASMRLLVLGLILRRRRVALVQDACGWWNEDAAEMAFRQLNVKGCALVTTEKYIAAAIERRRQPQTSRRSVA